MTATKVRKLSVTFTPLDGKDGDEQKDSVSGEHGPFVHSGRPWDSLSPLSKSGRPQPRESSSSNRDTATLRYNNALGGIEPAQQHFKQRALGEPHGR